MELTKKILDDIIEKLAEEEKIFTNEAQFQFELAQALENYENENHELIIKKGDKILLEVLSSNKTIKELAEINSIKNSEFALKDIEKIYTDIVVKINNEYYAIELKYKTAYPSSGKCIIYKNVDKESYRCTFGQGAYDEGSYDFIKDVERLERLVLDRKDKVTFNFNENKEIKKGFAIILTNELLYWSKKDSKGRTRDLATCPYKDFYAFDKEKIGGETLGKDNYKKQRSQDRYNTITLKNTYDVNWKDYELKYKHIASGKKPYKFKYLILEVSNKNDK